MFYTFTIPGRKKTRWWRSFPKKCPYLNRSRPLSNFLHAKESTQLVPNFFLGTSSGFFMRPSFFHSSILWVYLGFMDMDQLCWAMQRTLIVELVVVLGTKKWSTVSYYFTTRSGTVKILDQRAIPGI